MHQRLRSPLLATLAVSALVFAGILGVRTAGALEALGLAAYDWHILLRPASPRPAPPVVLVTVTEEDIPADLERQGSRVAIWFHFDH